MADPTPHPTDRTADTTACSCDCTTGNQGADAPAAHPTETELVVEAHRRLTLVFQRDADAENPDDPMTVRAMPIVLDMPKDHPPLRHQLLAAAAQATVACCLAPQAGVDGPWSTALCSWYGARIRKIARRARGTQFARAAELPGVSSVNGTARARAFLPCPIPRTPKNISRLQISGTDLPCADDISYLTTRNLIPGQPGHDSTRPVVYINASLGMTAGKAAAQASHGSMMLAAAATPEQIVRWAATGFALDVKEVGEELFTAASRLHRACTIVDTGYTEIAPGSVTAVALWPAG
ncbi:aminoacyl-tRNA hydrolase [Corynebacterium mendelii]|uniref:peptidyl-tRNA hydrolase n=1 Tax=Corynebacterium mendelii TaxID=2765362 RepID=A0A939DZH9_9CORY|nr:aminoacyl-tRNA hydrolase [Corynebacterium mendelii]MBN9644125.1 peptidyl-tRNA hydrolase [Corynebacterium mendelii]